MEGRNDLNMHWIQFETFDIRYVVPKFAMRGCISLVLSFAWNRTGNVSAIGTREDVQVCAETSDFCRRHQQPNISQFHQFSHTVTVYIVLLAVLYIRPL